MRHRTIAIGDIHGHLAALNTLIELVDLASKDTLVLLGDYVDRGPQSAEVIQRIIDLSRRYNVVAIRGNHEEMMLQAMESDWYFNAWMNSGGDVALESYGGRMDQIPLSHIDFLKKLRLVHEIENHFFIYASFTPNRELSDQLPKDALWGSLEDVHQSHFSGKVAVVGHTPQENHQLLDRGFIKCIDTGCGFGGLLTAYDVDQQTIWQVTQGGDVP